ncbi:MAG TPA: NosD domain-containing protein [Trebonia sp.]|nr:NosD domain-containing protein [Trebonia sp.]
MKPNRFVRLAVALLAPLLVAGVVVAQAGAAFADAGHHGHVLYVSASGKHWNSDRSCRSAAFTTIQSAVNAAPAGSTVVVCPGTYHEQVVISKPLTLTGKQATIDETGVTPAFQVTLPGLGTQTIFAAVVMTSSGIDFTGFRVQHAQGEGILAAGLGGTVSGIVISRNAVVHNDLGGGVPPKSTYFQCAAEGQAPGDCGEGVHFAGGVAYSTIRDNFIADNSGGVLLSDDVGPTHNNVVEDNIVTGNTADCGITVPGHNPGALNSAGVPQPSVAGVYRNVIRDNVVTGNGVQGEGAGVLFANATAGTASYDNLVEGNYIAGNGLPGVTMHAHTLPPGGHEDLNGNVIVGNSIGKNNLDGDTLDGPPGPSDPKTTGVLVFSGGTPVTVTVAHNHIFDNVVGVWLSKPVTALGLRTNKFSHVIIHISAGH